MVSEIVSAGIVPGAMEMMDKLSIGPPSRWPTRAFRATRAQPCSSSSTAPRTSARRASRRSSSICEDARRDRGARRQGRRRARADLEDAQGGVRGDGPRRPQLLRAGLGDPAHAPGRACSAGSRSWPPSTACGGQRLPRRRRQPAPARLLRRARRGRGREGRGAGRPDRQGLRGRGRLDHRRARRGRRQEALHARRCSTSPTSPRSRSCAAPSTPTAWPTPAR